MSVLNTPAPGAGRRVVVANEDPATVAEVVAALREAGHTAVRAAGVLSAVLLAADTDASGLVVGNPTYTGAEGVELLRQLRWERPALPILYLAAPGRSAPDVEGRLPADVVILRQPFAAGALRTAVGALLRSAGSDDVARRARPA